LAALVTKVKLGVVSILATMLTAAALTAAVRGADAIDPVDDRSPTTSVGPRFAATSPSGLPARAAAQSAAQSAAPPTERAFVDRYCIGCHSDRAKTGGLTLQRISLDSTPEATEIWEKVVRKLRGGMMPPLGAPRPDQPTIDGIVSLLETSIDRAALARPNPGRSPLHRLNRTEYANAVRDLLALDIDATSLLPADDEANGFDNIADVLKVSPSLLEQYLTASRKIAGLAVGASKVAPASAVYRVPPDRAQSDHVEGLPLGTRGGIVIRHNFPLDADYDFRVNLLQNIVGYVPGLEWPHTLEISIDGERVFTAPVGGDADNTLSDTNLAQAKETLDQRLRARIRVKAGPRVVGVAFVKKSSAESVEPLQPFTRDLDMQNMNGVPLIEHVQIGGPFDPTGAGDTPSRRRIFVCRPAHANAREETACAKTILSTVARRAYRRPVDTDIDTLLGFYDAGRSQGGFDRGIEDALRFILTSPKFLFRDEPDPPGVAPGAVYPITDLELASRLSFFLWSSVPDDQLLTVATQGKLKDPVVLDRQVRRMLADARSKALVDNFAAQWLFVRNLQSFQPDTATFPNFDDNLRQAFRRESELFFESVMREDRNVLDLLTADYTFVNERLARHYGIPNVYGSRFRRVTLPDENRRGLLGQGSMLAVTSYPNRTSPVLRGKWILENILGTPPPPPPPNVPTLKENSEGGKVLSVRERLEEHRKNPACATCHRVMDPLGFSLDNFDATGEWRTKEAVGVPVDASGQLADGTPVDGPVALRNALLKHPEQFVRTMTEKLLTYGLGRGLEYYDMPVVRAIARDAARQNYRFSSLITGIVKSSTFQTKKAQVGDGGI
jgi:mono/diheme cytochrome c family protein